MAASGRTIELPTEAQRAKGSPCLLVIFGGSGDLSHRRLLPAMYNLFVDGELPPRFGIVGFAVDELDDAAFRALARDGVEKFSRRKLDEGRWAAFAPMIHFVNGSFTEPADYARLRKRLDELDGALGTQSNRVFYFAVPPSFIETCAGGLSGAGMIRKAGRGGSSFTRVVVEKPIGHDLASAGEINNQIAAHFAEHQTFRIDHYLGKETVENLMVLRFANSIFEPLWTSRFIDHVQITVAEQEGVGRRAAYYEHAGALRDMVQSHLLQVLCMIAMEPPRTTAADSVRDAKLEVLRSLRPMEPEAVRHQAVRGQYMEGLIAGEKVCGYRQEEHVGPDSRIETFVALKCFIDNWRWAGVPFYLRTGKRLPKRASEIDIYFNSVPRILFNAKPTAPLAPNLLTLRIQPDEGLSLNIVSKEPGAALKLSPVKVDFHYASASPEAYETLLRDVISGDQTLFMRRDTVEAAWRFIQGILDAWEASPEEPGAYAAGSWGPLDAELMMAADGRKWKAL